MSILLALVIGLAVGAAGQYFSLPAVLFCAIGALLAVVIFAATHHFMERRTESRVNTEEMETETKNVKNPDEEKNQD
jgi:membrane protein implicated in regulation of membrane protease activity